MATISLLRIVVGLFLLYIGKFYVSLCRNYLSARKTGFPIVVVPIHPNHPIWMIIGTPLRPIIKRYASSSIYSRVVLSIYGWEYHEKRTIFRTLGSDSFILVTCNRNDFYTIDPEAIVDICKRAGELDKPVDMKVAADIFGPSLLTSIGDAWSRQRKLITGVINERISRVVFEETWRQTRAMVDDIDNRASVKTQGDSKSGLPSAVPTSPKGSVVYEPTFRSMKRIASNVLSFSAYGKPQAFESPIDEQVESTNIKLDMIECINVIVGNIILAAFIPGIILSTYASLFPGATRVRRICSARSQYPGHVQKRLHDEREALKVTSTVDSKSNLTSLLIQSSEVRVEEGSIAIEGVGAKKPQHQLMLSEDELQGNLFIFTTAGFETTSNALTYTLVSLMAEPKWQDWIHEEIEELFTNVEINDVPDYASFYPKAFKCQALMMEVLRLHPPVVHLARNTPGDSLTSIKTSLRTYNLPHDCHIYIPFPSLHTNPKVWRNLNNPTASASLDPTPTAQKDETIEDVFAMTQDEYVFRPSRWINQTLKQQSPDNTTTQILFQPPRGTYMPFSGGPRVCPGQKMAQIEFVCVILALLKDYRIEAVEQEGESDAQVQERMRSVIRDSHAEMTMVMERLHEVQVRFIKRGKA